VTPPRFGGVHLKTAARPGRRSRTVSQPAFVITLRDARTGLSTSPHLSQMRPTDAQNRLPAMSLTTSATASATSLVAGVQDSGHRYHNASRASPLTSAPR